MSRNGLEGLNPFLVLVELLVALVSGLVSLMVLVVMMLLLLPLSILVLVSMSAGETGAGELWLSDLGSGGGVELQATPEESLATGLSGGSV